MNKPTHMMGGVVFALTAGTIAGVDRNLPSLTLFGVFTAASAIGGLLPDIDKKNTAISHKAKLVSFVVRLFTTHRGFTHSLLALVLLGGILYTPVMAAGIDWVTYGYYGILLGYLSHLVLDMLNPEGIPLLFPVKFKVRIAGIKTGGIMEHVFRALLVVVTAILLFYNLGVKLM